MTTLYFVWRFSDKECYRAYGIRNHVEPEPADAGCIWRGSSYAEARQVAAEKNWRIKADLRKVRDGNMRLPL